MCLSDPARHNGDTDLTCSNCSCELVPPYILCVLCNANICALCFSQGVEFGNHKSDHGYQIIRDDFLLFANSDWSAREEMTLLDSIQKYKNWNSVARELPGRTVRDVKLHYNEFYLSRKYLPALPKMNPHTDLFIEPIVPYRLKIKDSDEPPRYLSNTVGYKSLAGYNPARSDFECEFDSTAEDLLSNFKLVNETDPHYDMLTNLQQAIIRCYNRRLLERQRWKRVIRDHGLIVLRKVYAWLHRYDVTITRPVYEKLIRFMQFCDPLQFEMIMEGLHRSGELKLQILRLVSYLQ